MLGLILVGVVLGACLCAMGAANAVDALMKEDEHRDKVNEC